MKNTQIQSFMTKNVYHVPPETNLREVATIMRDRGYSCVVVTRENKPVGIVTERDLVTMLANFYDEDSLQSMEISTMMANRPLAIKGKTSVINALKLAESNAVRHLPVVDDSGCLVGLVTFTDMVRNKLIVLDTHEEIVEKSVKERTLKLEQSNEELLSMALEDPLMKIGNRRAMEQDVHQHHEASVRHNRFYSIALLDIDYFKNYNDFYGHSDGDNILKIVATKLKGCIREADRIYRYGGEEFLMLLAETRLFGASLLTDRVVEALGNMELPHNKSPFGYITISIGVAGFIPGESETTWQQIVRKADVALYLAKERGRNRSVVSEDGPKAVAGN